MFKNTNKNKAKKTLTAWLFVLPGLLFTIILRYIPIVWTAVYSLHEFDFLKPPGKFVGLKNYASIIFNDSFFRQS